MNKLIATLIVGAFSTAAFAVTPAAPAAPATAPATKMDATPAAKTEAKAMVQDKKAAAPKADGAKKTVTAPKVEAVK
jgi:hypothetical protein